MRERRMAVQLAQQMLWDYPLIRAVSVVKRGASWGVEFTDRVTGIPDILYGPREWVEWKAAHGVQPNGEVTP